jgi:hypothetical protein
MDINQIENQILQKHEKKNKCTMFGINLGLELNQKLTNYALKNKVSKASIVKILLTNYLNEKGK